MAKEAIDQGLLGTLSEGLRLEAGLFGLCFVSLEQKEGMSACFSLTRQLTACRVFLTKCQKKSPFYISGRLLLAQLIIISSNSVGEGRDPH